MLIEYNTNNSGGDWWLSDQDWVALEDAGWEVAWVGKEKNKFTGLDTFWDYGNPRPNDFATAPRFLGTIAHSARKDFPTENMAKAEWEALLTKNPDVEGCSCCGQPHYFTEV